MNKKLASFLSCCFPTCLKYLTLCNCRRCIISKLALLPPKLPTYTFRTAKPAIDQLSYRKFTQDEQQGKSQMDQAFIYSQSFDQRQRISSYQHPDKLSSNGLDKSSQEKSHNSKENKEKKNSENELSVMTSNEVLSAQAMQRNQSHQSKLSLRTDDNKNKLHLPLNQQPKLLGYSNHQIFYQPSDLFSFPPQELIYITKNREAKPLQIIEDVNITGYFVKTEEKNILAVSFIEFLLFKSEYLVLFSHANSADLGYMVETFVDIAINMKVNLLGYDYSGYGQSTGKLDDNSMLWDIQAVYKFATRQLGFEKSKIILLGQSIGSGPSICLAAHPEVVVGGLILLSALASGLKVVQNDISYLTLHYYDIFPNFELISYVRCPILIIHGTKDQDIDCSHVEILKMQARSQCEIQWIEGAGHNNIDGQFRKEFITILKSFYEELKILEKEVKINIQRNSKQKLIINVFQRNLMNLNHLYSVFYEQNQNLNNSQIEMESSQTKDGE